MASAFALCFEGQLRQELLNHNADVYELGAVRLTRPDSVLRARRKLAALLREESFDLVVCHQPWVSVLFGDTTRSAGFPLILWVHMASDGRHWLEKLARLTPPDLILCNSDFSATRISLWFPDRKVTRVHYALSPVNRSDTLAAERESFRRSFGAGHDAVVIVMVSRLEQWKGHQVLLRALSQLRDDTKWLCWIAGGVQQTSEHRYLNELKTRAGAAGIADRVRFLGQRSDVPRVLRAADVFCQPNIEPEPFGLALVEALAAGLPVVTSGIGGACEIVEETCGILTGPGDVDGLAGALRHMTDDAGFRARLGAAAPNRADTLCNAPRQMNRIAEVLSSALTSKMAEQPA
jgi:glycosyltransferase involved in cell wall biosynthesis